MDRLKADLIELINTSGIDAYLGRRPQNSSLPAITINLISRMPEYADDGEAGLAIAHVMLDCWASTITSATDTAATITQLLSGYSTNEDATNSPTPTSLLFLELVGERDLSETGADQVEYIYRVSQDYRIVERRTN